MRDGKQKSTKKERICPALFQSIITVAYISQRLTLLVMGGDRCYSRGMNSESDPDQHTINLIRNAIKKNHARCNGLSETDREDHFFCLSHQVYQNVIGTILNIECSECGSSDEVILKNDEQPPNPKTFICYCCLHPDDEDE